ncbi:MAG: methyltransferase domain-containing protein [Bacteroidetes bacterium]|nr:methyltransferase domain-containing protein [Bacteroidota bacterium]
MMVKVAEKDNAIVSRFDKIVQCSRGKKIIHLGFADHLPLIEQKMQQGKWLHGRILDVAQKCIGVDINTEAVKYISHKFGISGLYTHNITQGDLLNAITSDTWDYIILGEILEHIDNPVSFLTHIKERYGKYFNKMIITVPNAFDFSNIRLIRRNIEFINTDHRYWFTPYTLAKVAIQAGYKPDEFFYCQSHMPKGWLPKFLMRRYPMCREGLLMILSQK